MIPFDPTETGPADVYRMTRDWIREKSRYLIAAGVILAIAYAYLNAEYGWTLPSIPTEVLVLAFAMLGGAAIGYIPAKKLVDWLWHEDTVTLVELEADDGDLAVIEISADRFSNMTVLDHEGDRRPSTYLHEVRLASGGTGYEVDRYNLEDNVAVASWMAGATNRDIRRHEKATKWIKKELSREADKSLDALVNAPEVMRAQGSVIANTLIRAVEGVEKPGEDEAGVYQQMYDVVEEADVTGDLLADRGVDDVDEAIKEFAEESSNGEGDATELEETDEAIGDLVKQRLGSSGGEDDG